MHYWVRAPPCRRGRHRLATPPGDAQHFCVATVNGDAKRGYFFKIVLPMVYYLKSFQVWVNFI
jgi:hypothetical protein